MATWRGVSSGLLSVELLLDLATKAGGQRHHLRAVQLPISPVHLTPVAQALAGHGLLVMAQQARLDMLASVPLHGGELPGMFTPELSELIQPGSTPVAAALRVVTSVAGVSRALLSTGNPNHWRQAAAAVAQTALSREPLQRIVDVLGT